MAPQNLTIGDNFQEELTEPFCLHSTRSMLAFKDIIAILGFLLVTITLWDAFEVIILPRHVKRRLRFARFFYRFNWRLRSTFALCLPEGKRREACLANFGPLSLLLLLSVWASGLVTGFAMLHWGLQDRLNVTQPALSFGTYLYLSGTRFFTLGLGDVIPLGRVGRSLVVVEAGLGFGFLAGLISYLPIIYQAFSRREVSISLLDAPAGSPPTAAELLRRNGTDMSSLSNYLLISLPPWFRVNVTADSWQSSNWQALVPAMAKENGAIPESHFGDRVNHSEHRMTQVAEA